MEQFDLRKRTSEEQMKYLQQEIIRLHVEIAELRTENNKLKSEKLNAERAFTNWNKKELKRRGW